MKPRSMIVYAPGGSLRYARSRQGSIDLIRVRVRLRIR